jgi:AcrR family transcriptional regulator
VTLQPSDEHRKRRYSSPRRDQQAQETRRAILEAALGLFTSIGFHQTTVKDVAERAAVSEQTVYNAFGDKIGLLFNAGMMFIDAGGDAADTALIEALRSEPDPIRRIRIVARDSREFWTEGAEAILQLELLVADPELPDPRLDELAEKSLAHKLATTRTVAEFLFPDEIRRTGFDLDDIVEYLATVDSATTILTLRTLGWDMERWERWVVQLLTLFLDPAATR